MAAQSVWVVRFTRSMNVWLYRISRLLSRMTAAALGTLAALMVKFCGNPV